jgi:hypothetical protein
LDCTAARRGDDLGCFGNGQRLGTCERERSSCRGRGVSEHRCGDGSDVVNVDECFAAVPRRKAVRDPVVQVPPITTVVSRVSVMF